MWCTAGMWPAVLADMWQCCGYWHVTCCGCCHVTVSWLLTWEVLWLLSCDSVVVAGVCRWCDYSHVTVLTCDMWYCCRCWQANDINLVVLLPYVCVPVCLSVCLSVCTCRAVTEEQEGKVRRHGVKHIDYDRGIGCYCIILLPNGHRCIHLSLAVLSAYYVGNIGVALAEDGSYRGSDC